MLKKNKKIYIIKKQKSYLSKTIRLLLNFEICFTFIAVYLFYVTKQLPNIIILLLLTIALCFLIINSYMLIKLVYLYRIKNIYNIKLTKIRLKYKKFLVHHKYNFSNIDYNKIYEYNKINKLVDLAKKSGKKIYYFETTPGEKCFFLLEAYNNLYKFILNK